MEMYFHRKYYLICGTGMIFLCATTIKTAYETHPISYTAGGFGSQLNCKTSEARILQEYGNLTSTTICLFGINTRMFLPQTIYYCLSKLLTSTNTIFMPHYQQQNCNPYAICYHTFTENRVNADKIYADQTYLKIICLWRIKGGQLKTVSSFLILIQSQVCFAQHQQVLTEHQRITNNALKTMVYLSSIHLKSSVVIKI